MAKDNDNGLYLPLMVDFDAWEQSLAQLDGPLQSKLRQLRQNAADIRLKYEVDISNAKAAGDKLKVMQLQTAKLTQLLKLQEATVNGLTAAYKKQAEQTGVNSREAQQLARELQRQTIKMNDLKAQLNATGEGLGAKIADGLASLSPTFASVRQGIQNVSGELATLSTTAGTAGAALGVVGAAAAGLYMGYKGLEALTDGVNKLADAGKNASDPIYQLRESIQGTYDDAEYLFRVTAIDGSNATSLTNALTKLYGQLEKDKDGTTTAARTLERYGASLKTAEGQAKSYKEQLRELSRAAQLAASVGELQQFKAGLGGAFRSVEFDHLLLGLEDYEAKAKAAASGAKIYYDGLHHVDEWQKTVAESARELTAIQGGMFADASVSNLKEQVDTNKALARVLSENAKAFKGVGDELGGITSAFTEFKGVALLVWESVKKDVIVNIDKLREYQGALEKLKYLQPMYLLGMLGDKATGGYFSSKIEEQKAKLEAVREQVKREREEAEAEAESQKNGKKLGSVKDVKTDEQIKAEADAQKARADAEKKLADELRAIGQTEYEREIQRIADKRDAYIKAGADEVQAQQLYEAEKEAIDRKYYDKAKAERDKQVKETIDGYKKIAEEQKRAREAAISEAERNLQQNIQIIRKLQQEEAKGGDYVARTKDYADKMYKQRLGIKDADISALSRYGNTLITDIANARDRVLGGFGGTAPQQNATTNNNNVTVNFDNTIVENDQALVNLANKVAGLILPVVENAVGGTATANNF